MQKRIHSRPSRPRLRPVITAALLFPLLGGCAVVAVGDAIVGVGAAAVSVAATTVKVGAKAVGAAVDAVTPDGAAKDKK